MPGTEGGSDAFFSPDGQWIGFFADGKLKKAAVQVELDHSVRCQGPKRRKLGRGR